MAIRLLCWSDTHGEVPPLPTDFHEDSVTAFLHAGDLYDGYYSPLALARTLKPWLSERTRPWYGVRGNHDIGDPAGAFVGDRNLTGRVISLADNLLVAGLGFHGDFFYDIPGDNDLAPVCRSIIRQVRRLRLSKQQKLVLISHYPPRLAPLVRRGTDEWRNSYCAVAELLREIQPDAILCGHVHQLFGRMVYLEIDQSEILAAAPGPDGGVLELMDGRFHYLPLMQEGLP